VTALNANNSFQNSLNIMDKIAFEDARSISKERKEFTQVQ